MVTMDSWQKSMTFLYFEHWIKINNNGIMYQWAIINDESLETLSSTGATVAKKTHPGTIT